MACFQHVSYRHALGRRGTSPKLQCLGPLSRGTLHQLAWLLVMACHKPACQDGAEWSLHSLGQEESEPAQQTLTNPG